MSELTRAEKKAFIINRGWFAWYNANYWCHHKFDSPSTDCTNWGMSLDNAYLFETEPDQQQKILSGMRIVKLAQKIIGM